MAKKFYTLFLAFITVSMLAFSVLAAVPAYDGKYAAADFTPPDFADGDAATLTEGASATFTYSCTCGDGRKDTDCAGTAVLQMNSGSGFATLDSASCNIAKGASCATTYNHAFNAQGVYDFRIFCNEDSGTDYTQDATQYVTVTVEAPSGCADGETRPCALQQGICAGSEETCVSGGWPGCDYGLGYEPSELSCDSLDNDCDGVVDNVDLDGDGYAICPGPGIINELLLTSADGVGGSISIYEYLDGAYTEVWKTVTPDVPYNSGGGGEAGDLTGDGIPEFALVRSAGTVYRLEVWTPDAEGWSLLWSIERPISNGGLYMGDIMDFDGDGVAELLVSSRIDDALFIYGYDGSGFSLEAQVHDCTGYDIYFIAAGGDMDGDGLPEAVIQCGSPDDLHIYEYADGAYVEVATVPAPMHPAGVPMTVDDMEHGDVNGDGRDEIVFCGNSGQAHVLTAMETPNGTLYAVEYSSPAPASQYSFSQTCSVGDVTGDGLDDILVVNGEGAKVYSHESGSYHEVWVGEYPSTVPGIGCSFIGDADNDGAAEFLFLDPVTRLYRLYDGFANTVSLGPARNSLGTMIVGNLNLENDEALIDCDDGNPAQGVRERCGDGADNDCDTLVDEGCPTDYCGDSYCAGADFGETCSLCAADCACIGPNCKNGCCGDYVCGKGEDASICPVDCA